MALKLYLDNPEIEKSFEAVKATLPGADRDWVADVRDRAMKRFSEVGIPGPKVEEWKYTPLGFLANENFPVAGTATEKDEIKQFFETAYLPEIDGPVLVFVNGFIDPSLTRLTQIDGQIDGIELTAFSEKPENFRKSLEEKETTGPLNDLNKAFMTDGYMLSIAQGTKLSAPLQVIHIITSGADKASVRTRCLINVGENAELKIMETFIGVNDKPYWFQMVGEVLVETGAELSIYQLQIQGKAALHMSELQTKVAKNAHFTHASLQLGAEISRTELISEFTGENAKIDLLGAYLGRVKQSQDIFTRINHEKPNCQSNQLFRGVLDEGGKSAYQGKVVVARGAQKTNADQSNKNLLLSRKAEANAKPELLIYADDVKCSHGATVGELDKDQLFYLRSRGLEEAEAKSLLVEAFVSEVFDGLKEQIIADKMKEKAAGWLKGEVTA